MLASAEDIPLWRLPFVFDKILNMVITLAQMFTLAWKRKRSVKTNGAWAKLINLIRLLIIQWRMDRNIFQDRDKNLWG